MILNNTPQNQAVLSNVGQIGEFRIRNSAKAFNILSSGLYANKIRAIVRELSCNAVDSHVAAGKQDTPFDVHLPNTLEPWFSIRDYGTGLSHDQVTNIYTTYFESTKSDSNDFIGALGLGSKSPFSYTDNFTVTAIRDGRKGIYTAFINEHGVPSIALMHEESTNDPTGVEVKFSVNDRWDFDKFRVESQNVYTYFKLRPVVHGYSGFTFCDPVYKDKDIIKGVHYVGTSNNLKSTAVMGNIAYPIEVPRADTTLGNLRSLLDCGLVLEFDIGELDFQASREGLSYIPSTIQSIKNKLEALNSQLATHISNEANKLANYWDRTHYLSDKFSQPLWKNAVIKYVKDTKFPMAEGNGHFSVTKTFKLKVDELAKKYNINIRAFVRERYNDKCANLKPVSAYDDVAKMYNLSWHIEPTRAVNFVVTDTKRGAFERAKYHWRNSGNTNYNDHVYVLDAENKNLPMQSDKFFKDLYEPKMVTKASNMLEKERASSGNWGRASVLKLETSTRNRNASFTWTKAGSASDLPKNDTYYYIELNGWNPVGLPFTDVKEFYTLLQNSGLFTQGVYGVRKADIPAVRMQKNWVELSGYVKEKLLKVDTSNVMGLVKEAIDFKSFFKYNSDTMDQNSPYAKLYNQFKDVESYDSFKRQNLDRLFDAYKIQGKSNINPDVLIATYKQEVKRIKDRYPLLTYVQYYAPADEVVSYINMIDQLKGI